MRGRGRGCLSALGEGGEAYRFTNTVVLISALLPPFNGRSKWALGVTRRAAAIIIW